MTQITYNGHKHAPLFKDVINSIKQGKNLDSREKKGKAMEIVLAAYYSQKKTKRIDFP